jgi:two-component system sensor histidine kinase and response regulator WspE
MSMDDDLSQYSMLELFRMEAQDGARVLTEGLLRLEHLGPDHADPATLDALMRAAHSIKGAAAIVDLAPVVRLAHAMEDVFVAAQRGRLALGAGAVDTLLAAVDLMPRLAEPDAPADAAAADTARLDGILAALAALHDGAAPASPAWLPFPGAAAYPDAPAYLSDPAPVPTPAPASAPPPAAQAAPPAAGVAATVDDALLALASQARLHAHRLQPWIAGMQRYRRQQRGMFEALDALADAIADNGDPALREHARVVLERVRPLKDGLHRSIAEAEGYERRAGALATRMVDGVLALRMGRFGDGVHALPRMVRDLARSLGKEVRLEVRGADVLVDRALLAEMESPLGHLLRNAVDHGMELPHERLLAGKPAAGTIVLEARHRGGMLAIDVLDDGRGVDSERIRRAAVARGLAAPSFAPALSEAELMAFLFLPGFSLKEEPNQISGRGVGMDVVHEAVQVLHGAVRAESQPGQGFRTAITLPLTQSIVRALLVEVAGEAYALPIARIERVLRVDAAQVRTLGGRQVLDAGAEQVGLVAAARVLGLGEAAGGAQLAVAVIGAGRERYGLVVDAILGERSLTVQPLEPTFGKLRDVAAAALLDDGTAALILDVPDLLQSIARLLDAGEALQPGAAADGGGADAAGARTVRRILVADDSLTVRETQRKILAAHGYRVDTAIDGIDGWNLLKSGEYDLVITDVDMPRLDGIGLLKRIRADAQLQRLPTMIVSYKDRLEDRARGLEAGADHYLAKGAFHDASLLEAVRDLIGAPEDTP